VSVNPNMLASWVGLYFIAYDNDFIIKLLLLQGEDGMGGAGLGGSGFEFGVDPNEDPELALVSTKIHSCMLR
jgi:hypothetical protein